MTEYPIIDDEAEKTSKKRITIDPITRLEGHGKIEIFLDEKGNVRNAYTQIPEVRGFERFCVGRPVEELARITTRLCGVCPGAHHMASCKALDAVFDANPPSAAKKLRELYYSAHYIHSHVAHFFALAAPDFVAGPSAPKDVRNILGEIGIVGIDVGKEIIKIRSYAQKIQEIVGGKATHPVSGLPGGMSRPITDEEREKIEKWSRESVDFSMKWLELFEKMILGNNAYFDLITQRIYYLETYYLGLVDKDKKVNFYDGKIRIVKPNGDEYAYFEGKNYLEYIAEHVEPWTYLKFPYIRKIGWKGLVDGEESGIYRVAPLARLNASEGFTTAHAQEYYEKMYEKFEEMGYKKPIHFTLAMHWARLIETLYAAERMLELSQDDEITSKDLRSELSEPSEGIGVVEAPRGILIHHYVADEKGITKKVNLIVGTGNNNAAINMDVRNAAMHFIRDGMISDGILNKIEMAFRAYDPCFSCATHITLGTYIYPIKITVHSHDEKIVKVVKSF